MKLTLLAALALSSAAYALNPQWSVTTGGAVESSPVTLPSDGSIIFGSADNIVRAVKPDGTAKWQFTATGPVYSAIKLSPDNTLVVFGSDGEFCVRFHHSLTLRT